MSASLRRLVLIAGAGALISAQAAHAAPQAPAPAVDPLVSLSLFSTAQSRAAVCGAGSTCVLPAAAAAPLASPALAGSAALVAQDGRRDSDGKQWLMLAGIIALIVAIAVGATLISGNEDGPVSPD